MAKATGLGGIFYKVADPDGDAGVVSGDARHRRRMGAMFRYADDSPDGCNLLSPFKAATDHFAPSELPFMINLRADEIDGMLADLKAKGIEPLGRQHEDYGKFACVLDPDGVKVELWQQVGPSPA